MAQSVTRRHASWLAYHECDLCYILAEELNLFNDTHCQHVDISIGVLPGNRLSLRGSVHPSENYQGGHFYLTYCGQTRGDCQCTKYEKLPPSTGGLGSLHILRNRLRACIAAVPAEQSITMGDRFVPTRLLEIKSSGTDTQEKSVRVVDTDSLPMKPAYLSLSHRWSPNPKLRLLKANIELLRRGISWDMIPRTYADALLVTLSLGYNYIWIDALCIVQDDMDDWHAVAAEMGLIYRNTDMNIYAANSIGEDSGIFKTRDTSKLAVGTSCCGWPGMLGSHWLVEQTLDNVYDRQGGFSSSHYHGLSTRGWVLQEEYLPPVVAYFGAETILWNCRHTTAGELSHKEGDLCKTQPVAPEIPHPPGAGLPLYSRSVFGKKQSASATAVHWTFAEKSDFWGTIVGAYSTCDLTFDYDKLSAIGGIAQEVSKLFEWSESDYIAGMWKPTFLSSMLWHTSTSRKGQKTGRSPTYTAPSWSWACIRGSVKIPTVGGMDERRVKFIASILHISISTLAGAFGPVTDGYMTLKSQVWRVRVLEIHAVEWSQSYINGVFATTCGHRVDFVGRTDDEAIEVGQEVFLAVRAIHSNSIKLAVDGLMLHATGNRGEFRRMGTFDNIPLVSFLHKDCCGHDLSTTNYLQRHDEDNLVLSQQIGTLLDDERVSIHKQYGHNEPLEPIEKLRKDFKDPNYSIRIV